MPASTPQKTVQWTIRDGRVVPCPKRKLAGYSAEDIAKHDSAASAWTIVGGLVLDVTTFLDHHPGGRLALLKYAGGDSTEIFREVHIPAKHYVSYVEGLAIGTLERSRIAPDIAENATVSEPIEKFFGTQLDTPFPAERFYGSGLETFRFEWAIRDQMIMASTGNKAFDLRQAHRHKAKVAPLNDRRDWLQIGDPAEYVTQMKIRERLVTGKDDTKPMVYVVDQDAESMGAQTEVLESVLEWLPRYHPDKFRYDTVNNQVHTLTPGYVRTFNVKDFAQEPLVLCGLLIQEDLFLLREEDIEKAPSTVDLSEHKDVHPTGTHHMLVGGLSCFTFDYREKHGLPMTRIHHPFVPGFQMHLQRNVNRLFNEMDSRIWWRHNYAFESDQVYHCVTFDKPWAEFVVPKELLTAAEAGTKAALVKTEADAEANSASSAFNPGAGINQDRLTSEKAGEPYDYIDQMMRMHIEYQTLHRMPKSKHILFTVRTYYDRMHELKKAPGAAQALGAAMRRKYKGVYKYQNLDRPDSMKAVIGWLDDITAGAGLTPGPEVKGPWDRPETSPLDGTDPSSPDHARVLQEARTWQDKGFERSKSSRL